MATILKLAQNLLTRKDAWSLTETELLDSGLLAGKVITLDVLANDLRGLRLYAIDASSGGGTPSRTLLNDDLKGTATTSAWETLASGDRFRIANGKIEVDLSASLARHGARSVAELEAGEQIDISFAYMAELAGVPLSWSTVSFRLTGESVSVNHAPTIVGAGTDAAAAVTEDGSTPTLQDSGTLTFTDIDLADVHTAAVTRTSGTLGGTLTLGPVSEGPSTAPGTLGWTYTVTNAAVQFLSQGQTAVETFEVTIGDGRGGSVVQPVTVTATGTNDRVSVVAASISIGMHEDVTGPARGFVSFTDADLEDSYTGRVDRVSGTHDQPLGSFTTQLVTSELDGQTFGRLGFDFVLDPAAQQLAEGETATEVHRISITDQNGDTASRDLTLSVTGANDGPVALADTARTQEQQTLGIDVLANDTDVDRGAVLSLVSASTPSGQGSAAVIDGKLVFDPGMDFAHLHAGQSAEVRVDYTIQDEHGATASSTVTVTVRGEDEFVVAGTRTGEVAEDAGKDGDTSQVAAGQLVISGPLGGIANLDFPPELTMPYGRVELSASLVDGTRVLQWTYTLANAAAAVQSLGAGDVQEDSVVVADVNGLLRVPITITIHGRNDAAVFQHTPAQPLVEDSGVLTTGGTVAVLDADAGEGSVNANVIEGLWGNFDLGADGHWTYTLREEDPVVAQAVQVLGAGASLLDTGAITSVDRSKSSLGVSILGVNDDAVVNARWTTGEVRENGVTEARGGAPFSDVDAGESAISLLDGTELPGIYGVLSLREEGWTYTLDNADPDAEALAAGQVATERFTVWSFDRTAQAGIVITVNGDDSPARIIETTRPGDLIEDLRSTTSGRLAVIDLDSSTHPAFAAPPVEALQGTYGSFSFTQATGAWSYTLDNTRNAVQALADKQVVHDALTITTADGLASHTVRVNIGGRNDAAVIIDTAAVHAIGEDDTGLLTGQLSVEDVDVGEASFQVPAMLAGQWGVFSLDASGAWTYDLDNAAVQGLAAGESRNDVLTVSSVDGTPHDLVVRIDGADEPLVMDGTFSGDAFEDSPHLLPFGRLTRGPITPGSLPPEFAEDPSGAYGVFQLDPATGEWHFVFHPQGSAALQALVTGETAVQSVRVRSGDNSQTLTVTVHGRDGSADRGGQDELWLSRATLDPTGPVSHHAVHGQLALHDAYNGQTQWQQQASAVGSGGWGLFTLDADGRWSYTVDTSALAALDPSIAHQDQLTVTTSEGQAHTLTVHLPEAARFGGELPSDAGDFIIGTAAADTVHGQGGDDHVEGLDGDDWLLGSTGRDTLMGGAGDDRLEGGDDGDALFGGADGDSLYGGAGRDRLHGEGGHDRLQGDAGDDWLDGGAGSDNAFGGEGNDRLYGGADGDSLDGGAGNDIVYGEAGDDVLYVGAGTDFLYGGDGTDSFVSAGHGSSTGFALLDGGRDADVMALSGAAETVLLRERGVAGDVIHRFDRAKDSLLLDASVFAGLAVTPDGRLGTDSWVVLATRAGFQDLLAASHARLVLVPTADDEGHELVYVAAGTPPGFASIPAVFAGSVPTAQQIIVSGIASGHVFENGNAFAIGRLPLPTEGPPAFVARVAQGSYGAASLDTVTGEWLYVLDNTNVDVDQLHAGDTLTDSFQVTTMGGEVQAITLTIHGGNDLARISGDASGVVVDGQPSAQGRLQVTDGDQGEGRFHVPADLRGASGLGSFTFTEAGAWTYTLDPGVDLAVGEELSDRLRVTSFDGSASRDIHVRILGSDEGTVTGGLDQRVLTELDALGVDGRTLLVTSGYLTAFDMGSDSLLDFQPATHFGVGAHGEFSLDAQGHWTYTLDATGLEANFQGMDSFVAYASNGAPHVVTVTIDPQGLGLTIDPNGTAGDDIILNTSDDVGTVTGGEGHDYLENRSAAQVIGDAGDDFLVGSGGFERLWGGDGNDVLIGGAGWNISAGGAGDDWLDVTRGWGALQAIEPGTGDNVVVLGGGQHQVTLSADSHNLILNFDAKGVDLLPADTLRFDRLEFTGLPDVDYYTSRSSVAELDSITAATDLLVLVEQGSAGLPELYLYQASGDATMLATFGNLETFSGDDLLNPSHVFLV